jgi:outer membrane immunogenic protein
MKRLAISLLAGVAALSFISSAHAADLIIEEPPVVGIVDVGGNWDGVYVGAFVGGAWGLVTDDDASLGLTDDELELSGWLLGVNAGANFTLGNGIVAGIVGDIAWSDISGEEVGILAYDVDWVGSVRGRLGFDGGAFLPYVTAGLAFASANATGADAIEDSQTHVGWTAGAGVEFAVADNLSLDLLYRYSDYGTADYTLNGVTEELGLTSHQVTAGINWKF